MTKQLFKYGISAGLISGLAGLVYQYIYQDMFFVDYSAIVNSGAIMGSSIIGSVLMALGYFALFKLNKGRWMGLMNLIYMVISFASILPAMAVTLPLNVEFPEMFPGLVVPMHFFVPMVFFGIRPFFFKKDFDNH